MALFDRLWEAQPDQVFDVLVIVTGDLKMIDSTEWLFFAFRAQVTPALPTPESEETLLRSVNTHLPVVQYQFVRFCSTPSPDPKLVRLMGCGLFLLKRPAPNPKQWVVLDGHSAPSSQACAILEYSPLLQPLVAQIDSIRQEYIRQIQVANEHHRLRREPISAEIRALEAQRSAKLEEIRLLDRARSDTRSTLYTSAFMDILSKIKAATNNQ